MGFLKKRIKNNKFLERNYINIHKKILPIMIKAFPRIASEYLYKKATGKVLDLTNPQDFNEKLQWLKLNWQHPLVVQCADKYEVRKYIENLDCKEILNELHGVYTHPSEIEWEFLPRKFALKTTNGCDTNIICIDKSELNIKEAYKKLEEWLQIDFGLLYAEIHYSKMTPKIICEKYIETENGKLPNDYKIFCFNGEPKYLYVGVIDEVGYTHKTFYDLDWNKQNFVKEGYLSYDHKKPKCLDEMVKYARILAKPFPFVRVDFYDYNGKPLFGEMTFTPTGGMANYYKEEALQLLGNQIVLPQKI